MHAAAALVYVGILVDNGVDKGLASVLKHLALVVMVHSRRNGGQRGASPTRSHSTVKKMHEEYRIRGKM